MMRSGVAILSVLMFSGAVLAVELEDASDKLVEAQGKLKTYSANIKATQQISKTTTYVSEGKYDWKRSGDKILYNQEIHQTATHDLEGDKFTVKEHRSFLCDGKNVYMINHENGNVVKQKYDPESFETMEVGVILDSLYSRHSELKVVGEEKVSGHDCYVIEGVDTWAEDEDNEDDPMITVTKQKYWFAKDIGMLVKTTGYDKKRTEVRLREYVNIKVNPDIDDGRFAYKAPPNANLVDHSQD